MAKVTKHYETHDIIEMVPVKTSKTVSTYHLELSYEEALVVSKLCGAVGATNKAGRKAGNVFHALEAEGVNGYKFGLQLHNPLIEFTKDLPNA